MGMYILTIYKLIMEKKIKSIYDFNYFNQKIVTLIIQKWHIVN